MAGRDRGGRGHDHDGAEPLARLEPLPDQVAGCDPEYRDERQERARIGRWDMTQPGDVEREAEPVVQDPGDSRAQPSTGTESGEVPAGASG